MQRRKTTQRSVILKYLRSTDTHPSAKEVYANVRRQLPGISVSTVYRTLSWLRDGGEALELKDSGGISHYDGAVTDHCHIWCVSCGLIRDVDLKVPELKIGELEARSGFQVRGKRFELFGLCSRCRKKEEK